MRLLAWLVVVLAMAGTAGGLGWYKYAEITAAIAQSKAFPEQRETVIAATVRRGDWSATTRSVGTVVAMRQVALRNELAGTVTEVGFVSGEVVEPGHVLVRLDTSEERAELAAAEAEQELARLTLDRRTRLSASSAASKAELDTARAQLRTAEAQTARLRAVIAKKTLTAPFRAKVGLRDLQPGAFLDAASMIVDLKGVDPDAYVDFSLPQDLAIPVDVGGSVGVSGVALAGGKATARIIAAEPAIDDTARSVRFRAMVEGLGDRLRPGAFVDITAVTAASRSVLLVPLTAVRRAPYGDHVWRLEPGEDGSLRARQRFVSTGPVQGEEIVVLSGITEGEQIAANGSFKLREGLLVIVAAAATAQLAPATP